MLRCKQAIEILACVLLGVILGQGGVALLRWWVNRKWRKKGMVEELVVKIIKGVEKGVYHAYTKGIDSVEISGGMSVEEIYRLIERLKEIPQEEADEEYERLMGEDDGGGTQNL